MELDDEGKLAVARGAAYQALATSDGFRFLLIRLETEAGEALKALRTPYMEDAALRETVLIWRGWERMLDIIKREVYCSIDEANELTGGTNGYKP
jgi:hypothetical protein